MDFNDTTEQAQFRKTCREWLEQNAEPKSSSSRESFSDIDFLEVAKQWQKKKYDAGWAMLHWPKEYGGMASKALERIIWAKEESKVNESRSKFEIRLSI